MVYKYDLISMYRSATLSKLSTSGKICLDISKSPWTHAVVIYDMLYLCCQFVGHKFLDKQLRIETD